MIKVGNTTKNNIKVGSRTPSTIKVGSRQVWPSNRSQNTQNTPSAN